MCFTLTRGFEIEDAKQCRNFVRISAGEIQQII